MSIISGGVLSALALTLISATTLLFKAIVDNLRAGDSEDNVKL